MKVNHLQKSKIALKKSTPNYSIVVAHQAERMEDDIRDEESPLYKKLKDILDSFESKELERRIYELPVLPIIGDVIGLDDSYYKVIERDLFLNDNYPTVPNVIVYLVDEAYPTE